MAYVFLPFNNEIWLHKIEGEYLLPVVIAPGTSSAKHFVSTDQDLYVCLDQSNKRITVYMLLDNEPWLERIVAPVTLPKSCFADDILIHNHIVYVGGRSRTGECLWKRGIKDNTWVTVPLPSNFPRKKGKSVDLLFHEGNKLIAIDNIILPKWILTYDISHPENIVHLDTIDLEQHTSYEMVNSGTDNKKYIALLSAGINYGTIYQYVSILDKVTLKELWVLFAYDENIKYDDELIVINKEDDIADKKTSLLNAESNADFDHNITEYVLDQNSLYSTFTGLSEALKLPVDFVCSIGFIDKYLLFATTSGLFSLDISYLNEIKRVPGNDIGIKFKKIATSSINKVYGFNSNPCDESSIFVYGLKSNDLAGYEVVRVSQLCA